MTTTITRCADRAWIAFCLGGLVIVFALRCELPVWADENLSQLTVAVRRAGGFQLVVLD